MKNEVEINKIDIKIGDKVISLKPAQAKELKKILNEMFEEKVVHEHHHDHYRYWWNWPTYTATSPTPSPWTVYCSSGQVPLNGAFAGTSANASRQLSDITLCLN